jgi:hypothetical protein
MSGDGGGPPWIDDHHTFHAGLLVGTLFKHGLKVQPVHDRNGVVTPILNITDDEGYSWSVIIMPAGSTADRPADEG